MLPQFLLWFEKVFLSTVFKYELSSANFMNYYTDPRASSCCHIICDVRRHCLWNPDSLELPLSQLSMFLLLFVNQRGWAAASAVQRHCGGVLRGGFRLHRGGCQPGYVLYHDLPTVFSVTDPDYAVLIFLNVKSRFLSLFKSAFIFFFQS